MKKWIIRILKWTFGLLLAFVITMSIALTVFKDEIINYAVSEINKKLKVPVKVREIDLTFWSTFPNLSIDFNHVFIRDAIPEALSTDTLMYTEQIRLKFNPVDVWNENYKIKKITISPGVLNIKINDSGQVNYDILKPTKQKENTNFDLELKSISSGNFRFNYLNEKQEQTITTLIHEIELSGDFTQDLTQIESDVKLNIQNIQNGLVTLIKNQEAQTNVKVIVDQLRNTVIIPKNLITVSGLPFQWSLFMDSTKIDLKVKSAQLPIQEVVRKLSTTENTEVHALNGKGFASFDLKLIQSLQIDAYPLIDCQFGVKNASLTEPISGMTMSQINVEGIYNSMQGKSKEYLNLKKVDFKSPSGPFAGNLKINQFELPIYKGAANGSLNLEAIHRIFRPARIGTMDGDIQINCKFHLQTAKENDTNHIKIVEGSGNANLQNVMLQLENDSRVFKQINGLLGLNKNEAVLRNCGLKLGNSDLMLNGSIDEIENFLLERKDLKMNLIAESKYIDLADFDNNKSAQNNTTRQKDWVLPTQLDGMVHIDVSKLKLEQHIFTSLVGNMNISHRKLQINQLHGISAQANVSGSITVAETYPEYFQMTSSLVSQNIMFKPLFTEWNNFDQHVITADNISGKAEASLDLRADFDLTSGIMRDEIVAQLQLKVSNGTLKNVTAFQDLTTSLRNPKTRLVLKEREINHLDGKLKNIQFETLENTIFIKNSKIIIPKMTIKSNALDITTEGTHSFNNEIDYRFSFRMRDLKIQNDESEFGELVDDGTGVKLWVRMHGTLDNPIIEWDKQSRKEEAKQEREFAKQEALSILKSEFGLFKNDSTIKAYQQKQAPREELEIRFDAEEPVDVEEEKVKTKKEKERLKKLGEKLNIKSNVKQEEFE